MRRIFFINCGGTPYCVTLYTTCMSISLFLFLWMHYDMCLDACATCSHEMCICYGKVRSFFPLCFHSSTPLTFPIELDIAHFSLLPWVDLGAKWQPINMWEWFCSLGVVVQQPTERFYHTSLWFSVFALSTRVKHQRRELTIFSRNHSLCLFLASGLTL